MPSHWLTVSCAERISAEAAQTTGRRWLALQPHPHCKCCMLCDTLVDCSGVSASCDQSCGTALLDFSRTLSNFEDMATNFFGWNNQSLNNPCAWTGITCQDELLSIDLSDLGLEGAACMCWQVDGLFQPALPLDLLCLLQAASTALGMHWDRSCCQSTWTARICLISCRPAGAKRGRASRTSASILQGFSPRCHLSGACRAPSPTLTFCGCGSIRS